VFLQVYPEELGIAEQIRNLYPHDFKVREREVFIICATPFHPVQGNAGIGFSTIADPFHGMIHAGYDYLNLLPHNRKLPGSTRWDPKASCRDVSGSAKNEGAHFSVILEI
jgi:hypothetical protein